MNLHFGLTNLPTTLFRHLRMRFEKDALREDEPSLRVDEHTDDVHSLLEENARFRGLLVQLSDLIRRNVVHAR